MQNNNNMNLLGFKYVIFDSFYEDNDFIHVYTSVKKMDTCPHCGSKRIWVHDHRIQKIKDTHIHEKKCLINLKKTRYVCKSCGCRFERELDFSEDLKFAYRLKKLFYQYVLTQPNKVRAAKSLREWIRRAEEYSLREFKSCTLFLITGLMKYVILLTILGLMVLLKVFILR